MGNNWELLTSIEARDISPLLFVLCMVPLSFVLRRSRAGYEWAGHDCKINHLLFMDEQTFWEIL